MTNKSYWTEDDVTVFEPINRPKQYWVYGYKIIGLNTQFMEAIFTDLKPAQIILLQSSGWTVEEIIHA